MTTADSVKALLPDFERACALAAGACLPWIGQGDKEAADAAAVDAMRTAFNAVAGPGRDLARATQFIGPNARLCHPVHPCHPVYSTAFMWDVY